MSPVRSLNHINAIMQRYVLLNVMVIKKFSTISEI